MTMMMMMMMNLVVEDNDLCGSVHPVAEVNEFCDSAVEVSDLYGSVVDDSDLYRSVVTHQRPRKVGADLSSASCCPQTSGPFDLQESAHRNKAGSSSTPLWQVARTCT